MKTLLILLMAGIGLGVVVMDKDRQLAAPLKARFQAMAPQVRDSQQALIPQFQPPPNIHAAVVQRTVSSVSPVQTDEPDPQFRIIQGDAPAPAYVTGRKVAHSCHGAIHFDLSGRAFCNEI